jgi:hypothetical protein
MPYWDPEDDLHPHDCEDYPELDEDDCDGYEGSEALTPAERNPSMLRRW